MARHEFRTAVGGSVVNHRDRRSGILTVPNHRWQALLQQVSGVEIQDNDIYGWGWQFVAVFQLDFSFDTRIWFFAGNVKLLGYDFLARIRV